MLKTLFVASTNNGKISEIKETLHSLGYSNIKISSLAEYPIAEPDEPYETFLENAIHKARYYGQHTMLPTLCDDSGLCVEALDNFPGVRTKDFAHDCGSLDAAFIKINNLLEGKSKKANFHGAVALYIPQINQLFTYEGKTYGQFCYPPRGLDGFGFHPVFIPDGFSKTMAELGPEIVKQHISQRVKSIKGLFEILKNENIVY